MISAIASPPRPEPFDSISGEYDSTFEENTVTRAIRPLVQRSLMKYFRKGNRILELNCGTGTDAVALAQLGISVTAIDSSSAMISLASSKASALQLSGLTQFEVMGFDDIDNLSPALFDGAFSNFGGLNCAEDISAVIEKLARRMSPGAVAITCLINKFSLWEIGSFLVRGKFSQSFRRFHRGGVTVKVGDASVHVRYYTPDSFARILMNWFDIVECYGLNIFSPGPNSRMFIRSHPHVTNALLKIDDRLRGIGPVKALGDHFVMIARRKGL